MGGGRIGNRQALTLGLVVLALTMAACGHGGSPEEPTEGQLTTLSEPLLFRPSSFLVTIWLLIASLQLRRTDKPATADRS